MVGIIANPKAGNGRAVKILSRFEKLLLSNKVKHILAFVDEGIDKVISEFERYNINDLVVFGGDGTVNSVARRIINKNMSMLVIPAGSGNDFSKSNWKEIDFLKFIKAIKNGEVHYSYVDVCYIKQIDTFFFNSFGIGISGSVVKNVKNLGSYRISIIKSILFDYRQFYIKINNIYEGKAISFHLGINQIEGHGVKMFPMAKNNDGLVDIVIFKNVPYFLTPFKISKVLKGKHLGDKYAIYSQFENIKFKINERLPAHYDGEALEIDKGIYDIITLKNALKILKWKS